MLKRLEPDKFEEYVDFVYELAMDLSKSSFPIYTDGIKTKEIFVNVSKKAFVNESEEILLFEQNGIIEGWIHYFVIEEDYYIRPLSILVRNGYAQALEELLEYWDEYFPTYEWDVYFPDENKEALTFMKQKGYVEEQEVVDVLLFKNYEIKEETKKVITINRHNFEIFRGLHSCLDDEMYWSCDKIFNTIDDWSIYAYMDRGNCLGSIYYNGKTRKDLEIFGIDGPKGHCETKVIESLLISCLNEAKMTGAKSMYFFNDKETHKVVKEMGFTCATIAHYFCKKNKL